MQLALRPYATTGAALLGGSVIALTPVAPPRLALPDMQSPAVRLTADGIDLLTPWIDQVNEASANASRLVDNFALAPAVGLQQAIVNQVTYLGDVINDPAQLGAVLVDMKDNLQTVVSSLLLYDASDSTLSAVQDHTLNGLHSLVAQILPGELPESDQALATTIVNVLSSPASAMLIGALGPIISPGVSLINSAEAIMAALSADDPSAAWQALLATPADFVGAFFNGATLNLDFLVPLLPKSFDITALSYAFGGLLTPGDVSQTYDFYNSSGDVIQSIPAVGGSMLNALGITALGVPIPGEPVGPIAALESFSQIVGVLLGDNWDAKGHPPVPPLSTLTFPTIPTGDSGSAAAVFTDALNAFNVDDLGTADSLTALLSGGMAELAALPEHILNGLLALF
ncbi:outer membrane porin GjpA [Mycobacterium botniense]|uniref:PE-PGRS family protein n=1 Tax=Mycobacterium botniense TaxID=84962 RepID=A0A7I9Y282_9MYCO|nr:outer membrane porin GjpA [Mycobacterium botniense]GFG76186.1 hypothetical protein MBOT_35510 [Mycobacterium botniense]